MLEAVKYDEVVFRQDATVFDPLARILARHSFEVLDKRVFAVRHDGVVLREAPARTFRKTTPPQRGHRGSSSRSATS